ncbi:hypothetical protein AB0K80_07420 [Streptomyces sp. NPDC052682]|uniref:hypothetical protein n=1 Tax=Streptomyces sp. NPDC052682 TaxID=3154954 RepID=UPI00343F20FA
MNKASRNPANGPQDAVRAAPRTAGGEPKNAARKGVLSAVRSDAQPVTITGMQPGLQVRFTEPPVADWLCCCGHHERARGHAAVIKLTVRVHVGICPHTTTAEGRAAA